MSNDIDMKLGPVTGESGIFSETIYLFVLTYQRF